MSQEIEVLLVDDHAVVRTGCRQLLQTWGGFAVTEAGTASEALQLTAANRPLLVILDLNLPDQSGYEVIPALLAIDAAIRILVFTMHEDQAHAAKAIAAGAHGVVSKSDEPAIIVEAADRVAQGEFYLSRPIAQKLALAQLNGAEDPFRGLTRREKSVLRLLGQGRSLSEIAGRLAVSYKTAANCCTQIKAKLNLTTSADLMRAAVTIDRDIS
jgi:DNA-binding NarL/FixJ family response regulator